MTSIRSSKRFCCDLCRVSSHRAEKEALREAQMLTLPLEELPRVQKWMEIKPEVANKLLEVFAEGGLIAFQHWANALDWEFLQVANYVMEELAMRQDMDNGKGYKH